MIAVVDDDALVRMSMKALLETAGYSVMIFSSARAFLREDLSALDCVIADIRMPDMDGLELQAEISRRGVGLPVIIMTGHGDVPLAVRAMEAGAINFIEKPFANSSMIDSVRKAVSIGEKARSHASETKGARDLIALLTPREKQVFGQLVAGQPNKVAAYELGMSPRTIEIHRANIMDKMNAKSLADLVRLSISASTEPKQRSIS